MTSEIALYSIAANPADVDFEELKQEIAMLASQNFFTAFFKGEEDNPLSKTHQCPLFPIKPDEKFTPVDVLADVAQKAAEEARSYTQAQAINWKQRKYWASSSQILSLLRSEHLHPKLSERRLAELHSAN